MSDKFNYKSILAPYFEGVIFKKQSVGIDATYLKWIFKEFDEFVIMYGLKTPFIDNDLLKAWIKTRISDSEQTLYRKWSAWSQLATHMCRVGILCHIPRLPTHPKSNFTPYIFTDNQLLAIFSMADSQRLYDIRMGTSLFPMPVILRLLYSTGMRVSEALSLKNKDVKLPDEYIHLRKTKNGCERMVGLSSTMSDILSVYIHHRNKMPIKKVTAPENLLFIKNDGTSISSSSVYNFFRKCLALCGIPHIGNHNGPRVHDLRHTNAVHSLVKMARNGMDLYTCLPIISANLGHRSISSTEKYVRLTSAMYPDLVNKCNSINIQIYPQLYTTDEDLD